MNYEFSIMRNKGLFLVLVIFILVGVLTCLYFNWYAYGIAFGLLSYLIKLDFKPFWLGFLSGALVWLISAIWIAQTHPSFLPEKMASILPLGGNVILLYVCTAIVGGLIGGVWTLAGAKLRAK